MEPVLSADTEASDGVRSPEEIEAGIARAGEALEAGGEAVVDYLTPLRPGENPLADQLIKENSRLRRERNDWMREAERLKRWVDAHEVQRIDGDGSGK